MENNRITNKLSNQANITNKTAVSISPETFGTGIATGISSTAHVYQSTSPAVGFKEAWSFFYCEYFKGLLFLSLSVLFIYVIPSIITKPGGISLMCNRVVKRGMDIFGALTGLILTAPLWIILPILIKLDSKGSVFYTQSRVGTNRRKQDRRLYQKVDTDDHRQRDRRRENYHGQTFKVIKFRTMVSGAEKKSGPVWATKNDKRITKLGNFLRKTRMDEIPQFVNILKGDMSLVGPRPERPVFVVDLSGKIDNYARRLEVKPGLTGLAQITNGYDSSISSVADKVRHDVEYIDSWSIWTDIKIILKTVVVVFTGKGAH